jgi:hydrophobe/amphiphile efflux-3 (HAE3) family protein
MTISNDIIIYTTVFVLSFITFYAFIRIGVKSIAGTVTAKPVLFFIFSFIIVGILGIGARNLTFEPDLKMLLPNDFPSRTVFDKITNAFGGIDTIYISVTAKNGTIWNQHTLSQIRNISQTLKTASYVDKVLSITEVKSTSNDNDIMKVYPLFPEDTASLGPAEMDKIRTDAKANDMISTRLISADEKSALIAATVNLHIPVKSPDGQTTYRWISDNDICKRMPDKPDEPTLLNIMNKYADPAYTLTLTGFPYLRYKMQLQMASDMKIFLILGLLVMLAFLYASFRTIRGMLLPLTIVLMGLAASFGFMGWMKEKITLPFLLMGPMLIAIAHNYGTQLIAKYYEDVQDAAGPFTRDAIKCIAGNCIVSIGSPVLISAVTVIVGFVTMISHPIRGLALLGFFCAFGIIVSFILTIILTPAILSMLNIPQMLIDKNHGTKTDKILQSIARFTIDKKIAMFAGVMVLAAACLYFIPKVEVDANFMNNFPKSGSIYKDAEFIGNQFGGYSTLNIFIESTHPVANNSPEDGPMKNPEILKWMEDFQKFAWGLTDPKTHKKLIGDALSMSDFVSYMNKTMRNDPNENRVPDRRDLIAQYLLSYESQSEGDFSNLVDYKYNKAQIIVRLPDMSTARLNYLISHLKQYIKEHPNKDIQISFGGTVEMVAEIGSMIVGGQLWSLALSVIIIIACYMIFFRSFTAGILAAIPLFCAITLVFGLMGILDIKLDYITATITGISIGAGTDYTAYFLWRLRERSRVRGNIEEGYVDTMTSIGKGIVYNGFSVVVGFFVFLFSNFLPIRFFGFLVSFSILACIVSTLTILPVVVFMVGPKFLTQREAGTILLADYSAEEPFAESKIPVYADGIPVEAETENE